MSFSPIKGSFWKTLGNAALNLISNIHKAPTAFTKTIGSATAFVPKVISTTKDILNPFRALPQIARHGFKNYIGSAVAQGKGLMKEFIKENKGNFGDIIGKEIADEGIKNMIGEV